MLAGIEYAVWSPYLRPRPRAQSPVSVGSTLMTLAPYWASIMAQYGPATPWLTSITFRPS